MPLAVVTLLLSLLTAPAMAADYRALPASTLGFSATYQGESFEGKFTRFTPTIRFDPAKLASSRFDVSIQLGSANTANAERDELLQGAEFFASASVPEARYLATRFRALGGNKFVAEGVLTLRGVSKAVPLTFTWTAGAQPVLQGTATLNRLDFKVGTGEWTDTELLPNAVKVSTRLLLAPSARP